MKTKLLAMMILAGGSMFAQGRFSVGLGFGENDGGFNQPPPAYASNIPPCPGPGYTWVDGFWSQDYGRPTWIGGYWSAPAFTAGYQFAPRFENGFRDRDDQRVFARGGGDRSRGFDQNRNFSGQGRGQTRGFNQGQTRGRSNGQDDHGNSNGFRGR